MYSVIVRCQRLFSLWTNSKIISCFYDFKLFRYEGQYYNGKRHGRGRMHFPDGSLYDGEWSEGDKSGLGTYTYRNGDSYEGEWKSDEKHGKGTYTYKSSGTQFKGTEH